MLQRLTTTLSRLIYWREPVTSLLTLLAGVFTLYIAHCYSALAAVSYVLLSHVLIRFLYANITHVLAEMNLMEKKAPMRVPESFITEAEVSAYVPMITDAANSALRTAFRLLVGECNLYHGAFDGRILKVAAALYASALAGRALGTLGVLFVLLVAAFSLPPLYERKQREIDRALVAAQRRVAAASAVASDRLSALLAKAKHKAKTN